jgi:hypothetical protein
MPRKAKCRQGSGQEFSKGPGRAKAHAGLGEGRPPGGGLPSFWGLLREATYSDIEALAREP